MVSITLNVAADHPATRGHFPDCPVVPGAVLLDAVARSVAKHFQLALATVDIPVAKFLRPVPPGAALELECESAGGDRYRFVLRHLNQTVATGQLRYRGRVESTQKS